MCDSVRKGDKGVDLLASLCNKYDTSEDELRKTMEKTNNLIADILKKKPHQASEYKNENLENINTGMFENFFNAHIGLVTCFGLTLGSL